MNKPKERIVFVVWDNKLDGYATIESAYRSLEHLDYAGLKKNNLMGFGIQDDGTLILCDEPGNFAYLDPDRFKVIFNMLEVTK